MPVAQGTIITATHYNALQARIALVLGSGSGDFGYGQSVASTAVAQFAKVSVTQWNNLRNDIVRCRQHQTGGTITNYSPDEVGYTDGSSLKIPTTSTKIKYLDYNAYESMIASVETNRLAIPPSPAQATRENLFAVQTRTANWNSTLTQTITVDFGSANAIRYFFNTGSRLEFSSNRAGGTNGPKDVSWTTILTNMGTIYFNRTNTTCTGTGNTSTIGWTGVTGSDQLIFSKDVSDSTYVPNQFRIYARAPSAQSLVFTLQWADASIDSPPTNPPWYIDEDVTGTLTSTTQVYRSSGDVVIPKPSASTSTL